MKSKALVTRKRHDVAPRAHRQDDSDLFSLQRGMNHLFDDFFLGLDVDPFLGFERNNLVQFTPKVNMAETDKEVTVSAELPGMDEKDVSVEVDEDTIRIHGEKKEEHEEKGKSWHRMEQSYGSFVRIMPLPSRVDGSKVKAVFRKGILTVNMPKVETAQRRMKAIEIKAA